jgi:hypothetical protein
MRNTIILFLAVCSLIITSCQDKDAGQPAAVFRDSIQGDWVQEQDINPWDMSVTQSMQEGDGTMI